MFQDVSSFKMFQGVLILCFYFLCYVHQEIITANMICYKGLLKLQKQSPKVALWKKRSEKLRLICRKKPVPESLFLLSCSPGEWGLQLYQKAASKQVLSCEFNIFYRNYLVVAFKVKVKPSPAKKNFYLLQ